MIETGIDDLDKEQLQRAVENEAQRLLGVSGPVDADTGPADDECSIPRVGDDEFSMERPEDFGWHELQKLHGREFVWAAYYAVLGREADQSGLENFSSLLRAGILGTRFEVVRELANSPEGRDRRKQDVESAARRPLANPETWHVEELLKLQGREFVWSVFYAVIGRQPAPGELVHYEALLREGLLSKPALIDELRRSPEGMAKGVEIDGFHHAFFWERQGKRPYVGRLIRFMRSIVTLPRLFRKVAGLDFRMVEQVEDLRKRLEEMASRTDRALSKVERELNLFRNERGIVPVMRETVQRVQRLEGQEHKQQLILLDMERRLARIREEISSSDSACGRDNHEVPESAYMLFEEQFRGPVQEVRKRLLRYLPHVKSVVEALAAPVADLGSGRGEWLQLLNEEGISACGVEISGILARQCADRGLDVIEADALQWLRSRPENSLSAVTGFHIVEHLPFGIVIAVLDEAMRVLKPGGMILFETPNPENIVIGACEFYSDPTHQRPIPPQTLKFIVEHRGFRDVTVIRSNPIKEVESTGNEDIDWALKRMFMERDYAVVGKK
ncbi:MAG: DUF4214 domain-containing protein [Desulfobulbaceae bacterium]|nr:DUF4214 domain-containing protein [Desulfobulbaceae bacterium]